MIETYSPPAHILARDVLSEETHIFGDSIVKRLRETQKWPPDEDSLEFQVALVVKVIGNAIGCAIAESVAPVWETLEEANIKALLEDEDIRKAVHHASKKREYQLIRNLGSCPDLLPFRFGHTSFSAAFRKEYRPQGLSSSKRLVLSDVVTQQPSVF